MTLSFEHPLFLFPAVVGVIFVLAGAIMLQFPPKKINGFYGYRTKSSMKSQARWDFAQKYAAREMMKLGAFLFLFGFLGAFIDLNVTSGSIIGFGTVMVSVLYLLIKVERAITSKFGSGKQDASKEKRAR